MLGASGGACGSTATSLDRVVDGNKAKPNCCRVGSSSASAPLQAKGCRSSSRQHAITFASSSLLSAGEQDPRLIYNGQPAKSRGAELIFSRSCWAKASERY